MSVHGLAFPAAAPSAAPLAPVRTIVAVTLAVVDTQTGAKRTFSNPLGQAYQPIQDTAAFATCP